jgi:anti-sigma regulatory factor (Ser/Thr protein kinase)
VLLELDSRPESVTLVRGMLGGVGETLRLDSELLDDVRTAVSEACNNVVIHAYGDGTGPLIVDCEITADRLEVRVRDRGRGIRGIAAAADRMGVGLAVISALSDRAEFSSAPGGGTEVRMAFEVDLAGVDLADGAELNGDGWPEGLDGDVVVRLAPPDLLAGVLAGISRGLAARARFSVDRLSEIDPVTDAIAAHASDATNGNRIGFAIASDERRLELAIGPFVDGSGDRLDEQLRAEPPTSPLALLADEVTTESRGDAELLRVVLTDQR